MDGVIHLCCSFSHSNKALWKRISLCSHSSTVHFSPLTTCLSLSHICSNTIAYNKQTRLLKLPEWQSFIQNPQLIFWFHLVHINQRLYTVTCFCSQLFGICNYWNVWFQKVFFVTDQSVIFIHWLFETKTCMCSVKCRSLLWLKWLYTWSKYHNSEIHFVKMIRYLKCLF